MKPQPAAYAGSCARVGRTVLQLPHPALSRALAQLAEQLGGRLTNRTTTRPTVY